MAESSDKDDLDGEGENDELEELSLSSSIFFLWSLFFVPKGFFVLWRMRNVVEYINIAKGKHN